MLYVVFFLVSMPAFAEPQLSDRIQLTEIVGPKEVKVIRAIGGKEELLHTGENIFVGDEVVVARRQIVGLAAYDGSIWKLAPGTRFKAEARKPDKVNLSFWSFLISEGSMWGKVQKSADAKDGFRLKVRSKTAALGIRGTEYLMEADEQRSRIDVLEGTVWWGKSTDFAPGTFKQITAGQHGEIGQDGQIEVSDSKGDAAKLQKDYGLVPAAGSTKPLAGTTEQCLALGKGWKSLEGSSAGECIDKSE